MFQLDPSYFYTGSHEALFVSRADGSIDEEALANSICLRVDFAAVLEDSGLDQWDLGTEFRDHFYSVTRPFSPTTSKTVAANGKAVQQ